MSDHPFLITARDLEPHIGRDGLSIVDASWYLPAQKRFARPEFEAGHIPGAVFFDQDEIADKSSQLPHTLPSEAFFAERVGALGVRDTDTIVVYDGMGFFSAPRVWWMLRVFGAKDVRLLDGGLPSWIEAGLPLETGPSRASPAPFDARLDREAVVFIDEMKDIVAGGAHQIADARSGERFRAEAPEPREGVRGGHMPGARSVPIGSLTDGGRLKDAEALRTLFSNAGIDPEQPVVTSCGSGVTAAAINFALASLHNRNVRLYDGSWTEWGSRDDTPVETGPAR
ncbi:3-mercaptopyruvate sulfurtransferase [Aureimonas ureilytica]|uniref:3-mercaptopyruvate sulfurtransferase n=1 Tax=Aureimonas ureilytica TaxID=401562 RepID=UPI003CF23797